jgi:hypothetical protein
MNSDSFALSEFDRQNALIFGTFSVLRSFRIVSMATFVGESLVRRAAIDLA